MGLIAGVSKRIWGKGVSVLRIRSDKKKVNGNR
jgi:hypothetical protein